MVHWGTSKQELSGRCRSAREPWGRCGRQFACCHCGCSLDRSDAYQAIMERVGWVWVWDGTWGEERAEAVLKMERASVPCQPLSCFRGLPGIFLSLPPNMLLISALNQNRSGQKPRGPHCAAADTGQGRDKLLCLDFIIHSWGTRDSRDCCQECPAAPFWGTYKWASVWSWPQETPLIDCRMLHSDTSFFCPVNPKWTGRAVQKISHVLMHRSGMGTWYWILIWTNQNLEKIVSDLWPSMAERSVHRYRMVMQIL